MNRPVLAASAAATALAFTGGACGMPLAASLTLGADDAGGRSIEADFSVSPTERLSFDVGAGHASGADDTGGLTGTQLTAGASLRGDRTGISLDYYRFEDPSNYMVSTLGMRAWFEAAHLRLSLLARSRDMGVGLTLELPRRTLHREMDFSAFGAGAELRFTRGDFSAYAMALEYDYDDEFGRFLAVDDDPRLERRPRIEALLGSFMMQAQGAIDRQSGLGAEYAFGRNALALDISRAHDAVIGASSTSAALSWQRAPSTRVAWSLTAGLLDSATTGDALFLSVSLWLGN